MTRPATTATTGRTPTVEDGNVLVQGAVTRADSRGGHMRWESGVAITAILFTAGCASGGEPTMSPAPESVSVTASPTPTSVPTSAGLNGKIGDTYLGNTVDVTVEQLNPKVTTSASDETWQAAMVKVCAKVEDATVSTLPWQVLDDNSGRYGGAMSYYGDAPKPLYPIGGAPVLKGECVRGWILFDAPATVKVVEVRYAGAGESVARWRTG